MTFLPTILFAASVVLVPWLGQAATISNAGTLSVGGYTFSNFGCSFSAAGMSTPGSCDAINVNTILQPGIGIEFSSGFSSFGYSGSGSVTDAMVTYEVTSTNSINSVGLSFDGNFYGQAIASVTEKIWNDGNKVGYASVACGAGQAGCSRENTISLAGSYNSLYVEKDIQLGSYTSDSGAFASVVNQTFDAKTPEPSSCALLGAGLLGLAGFLKRRPVASAKA